MIDDEEGTPKVRWAKFYGSLQYLPDGDPYHHGRITNLSQREGAIGRRWLPPHNRPAPAAPLTPGFSLSY